MSNYKRTILYVGMTNDVEVRVLQHKAGIGSVFTSKYSLKYLMYYEECPSIAMAILREKQLKRWHKEWKWNLIKERNEWLVDLAGNWYDERDILSVKTGRI